MSSNDTPDLYREVRRKPQESRRATVLRSASDLEALKTRYAQLQNHCQILEARIEIYAAAINLLATENAALSNRTTDDAKVRTLPRRQPHMP